MAEIILALDVDSADAGRRLLDRLPDLRWVKVGSVLMTREGAPFLVELRARGLELFLDLKWHDIPNTVAGAVSAAASLGVSMATVHTLGGAAMLAAAQAAAGSVGLVGVTVLTSHDATGYAAATGRAEVGLPGEVARLAGVAAGGWTPRGGLRARRGGGGAPGPAHGRVDRRAGNPPGRRCRRGPGPDRHAPRGRRPGCHPPRGRPAHSGRPEPGRGARRVHGGGRGGMIRFGMLALALVCLPAPRPAAPPALPRCPAAPLPRPPASQRLVTAPAPPGNAATSPPSWPRRSGGGSWSPCHPGTSRRRSRRTRPGRCCHRMYKAHKRLRRY